MISIFKKRTGPHENTIREFTIDHSGLKVGLPLDKFQGVLRGVPQYLGAQTPQMDENPVNNDLSERALILAPQGRYVFVAAKILHEGGLLAEICSDLPKLLNVLARGAGVVVLTDEEVRSADVTDLAAWVGLQSPWSDFPIVLLQLNAAAD